MRRSFIQFKTYAVRNPAYLVSVHKSADEQPVVPISPTTPVLLVFRIDETPGQELTPQSIVSPATSFSINDPAEPNVQR